MRIVLIFLLLTFSVSALEIPATSRLDKRITYANYKANEVFKIVCKNGFVSVLEFGKDESIENIATGFSDGWDLIPKGNFLFIKPKVYITQPSVDEQTGEQIPQQIVEPKPKEWQTNLIVTTNLNTYVFDLFVVDNNASSATYKLAFSYPQKIKEAKLKEYRLKKLEDEKRAKEQIKELEKEYIKKEVEKNQIPRNWAYYMKYNAGSENIIPNFAYDDGTFTYFGFDNTKNLPSVFEVIDEEGHESILNTNIKKDKKFSILVVLKTARKIVFRFGNKIVAILNKGYGINPNPINKDVISNKLRRDIKPKPIL